MSAKTVVELQKLIQESIQDCDGIDDLKKILTVLSFNLGVVSSALYLRDIPSDTMDRRINLSMLEGVEKYWNGMLVSEPLDQKPSNGAPRGLNGTIPPLFERLSS